MTKKELRDAKYFFGKAMQKEGAIIYNDVTCDFTILDDKAWICIDELARKYDSSDYEIIREILRNMNIYKKWTNERDKSGYCFYFKNWRQGIKSYNALKAMY